MSRTTAILARNQLMRRSLTTAVKVDLGDFFTGWRRKSGCTTLLIASLFAGCWIRSFYYTDEIAPYSSQGEYHDLTSISGRVIWTTRISDGSNSDDAFFGGWNSWPAAETSFRLFDYSVDPDEAGWPYQLFGIVLAIRPEPWIGPTASFTVRIVPYWVIVLPLLLLSGYLIIVTTEKRNSQKQKTKPGSVQDST